MNLQSSRVREPNHVRDNFDPHLQSVIDRPGDRTKRVATVHFRQGSLRLLFTVSHKGNPPVDTTGGGTARERGYRSDTDRNTKIHFDRLMDETLGCKL